MTVQVSVILPTYNRADTLLESIRSVLDQTFTNLELLVIDDGSTDHTRALIDNITDPRIRYVLCPARKGVGHARNIGLQNSSGEFIAFQDSDDIWLPEKLEKQMATFLAAPPSLGLVYTDMTWEPLCGEPLYHSSPNVVKGRLINPSTCFYQTYLIGIQSILVRKLAIYQVEAFRTDLPCFEDMELLLRISLHCECKRLAEPLVRYRETVGSISHQIRNEFAVRDFLRKAYKQELKQVGLLYYKEGLACFLAKYAGLSGYLSKGNYQSLFGYVKKKTTLVWNAAAVRIDKPCSDLIRKTFLPVLCVPRDTIDSRTLAILSPIIDYRLAAATELVAEGRYTKLIVFEPLASEFEGKYVSSLVNDLFSVQIIHDALQARRSTYNECRALVSYLNEHSIKTVTVVTSDYHTRRAYLTLSALAPMGMRFQMVNAKPKRGRAIHMAHTLLANYCLELLKLVNYWARYFGPLGSSKLTN